MSFGLRLLIICLLTINTVRAVGTRAHPEKNQAQTFSINLTERYVGFQEDLAAVADMINHSERFKMSDVQEILDFCEDNNLDQQQLTHVLSAFINRIFITCVVENKQTNAYKLYKEMKQLLDQMMPALTMDTDFELPDVSREMPLDTQNKSLRDAFKEFISSDKTKYGVLVGACVLGAVTLALAAHHTH